MQKSFIQSTYLKSSCLALLLAGCASEPIPVASPMPTPTQTILSGERMLSESKDIANLGERWKKGKQLIDEGSALIRDAKSKIDEGNRMINEGERVQRESEENYNKIKN